MACFLEEDGDKRSKRLISPSLKAGLEACQGNALSACSWRPGAAGSPVTTRQSTTFFLPPSSAPNGISGGSLTLTGSIVTSVTCLAEASFYQLRQQGCLCEYFLTAKAGEAAYHRGYLSAPGQKSRKASWHRPCPSSQYGYFEHLVLRQTASALIADWIGTSRETTIFVACALPVLDWPDPMMTLPHDILLRPRTPGLWAMPDNGLSPSVSWCFTTIPLRRLASSASSHQLGFLPFDTESATRQDTSTQSRSIWTRPPSTCKRVYQRLMDLTSSENLTVSWLKLSSGSPSVGHHLLNRVAASVYAKFGTLHGLKLVPCGHALPSGN